MLFPSPPRWPVVLHTRPSYSNNIADSVLRVFRETHKNKILSLLHMKSYILYSNKNSNAVYIIYVVQASKQFRCPSINIKHCKMCKNNIKQKKKKPCTTFIFLLLFLCVSPLAFFNDLKSWASFLQLTRRPRHCGHRLRPST